MESEIDFKNFGLVLDENLVLQIEEVLTEIYSLGDLNLRSAWLYYGSIPAAAKALQIENALYEQGLHKRFLRAIPASAVERVSDRDYDLIRAGADMILEMPDAKRKALFESHIDYLHFSVLVEEWFEENKDVSNRATLPITAAYKVLEAYTWPRRLRNRSIRLSRNCFQGGAIAAPLRAILDSRVLVETLAVDSKLCELALEIVKQYDTSCWHRTQVKKHKTTQRRILSNAYAGFFYALVVWDGKQCAECKAKRKKLYIDHIKPVSKGGLTEFMNLQLLCFGCNSKKSNRFVEV
jgi:5-methylcytosine-specific restriction endonuclease McrA